MQGCARGMGLEDSKKGDRPEQHHVLTNSKAGAKTRLLIV